MLVSIAPGAIELPFRIRVLYTSWVDVAANMLETVYGGRSSSYSNYLVTIARETDCMAQLCPGTLFGDRFTMSVALPIVVDALECLFLIRKQG